MKSISPRGRANFSGLSFDDTTTCSQPVIHNVDGMRIYGGGVIEPLREQTQYPRHQLNYRRNSTGMTVMKKRLKQQVKASATNVSKVVQRGVVSASKPKVKTIVTNHIYSKDIQRTN